MSQEKELIILSGLPASGKTLLATEILKEKPTSIRLSKDSLRQVLHSNLPWDKDRDKVSIDIYLILLTKLMSIGFGPIIIDDLNLNVLHLKYYEKIAEKFGYSTNNIKLTTTVNECIIYDKNRPNSVGKDYILNLAAKNGLYTDEDQFVIYEIDGVLCNGSIPVHINMNSLKEDNEMGLDIILLTNRRESERKQTEGWLRSFSIPYHRLIMKDNNDYREACVYKNDMATNLINMSMCVKVVDNCMDNLNALDTAGCKNCVLSTV